MRPLDDATLGKLRWVQVSDRSRIDLDLFPDFLIVGPQRTGTTWMQTQLARHPDVFMPAQKEIYYFNTLKTAEYHPSHLPPVSRELAWYLDHFDPPGDEVESLDRACRKEFGEAFRPKVRGEATATYAVEMYWHPDVLEEIKILNPNIRVILMVRDPIERAWSHAKKDLSKHRSRAVEDVPESEWIEFFENNYQLMCGRPTELLQRWTERVGEERLFVGLFKDVGERPVELLLEVLKFIGVRSESRLIADDVGSVINPTAPDPIPASLRAALQGLFGEEVEALRQRGWI